MVSPGGQKSLLEVDPFRPADEASHATGAFGFRAFGPSAGRNWESPVGSVVRSNGSFCAMIAGKG